MAGGLAATSPLATLHTACAREPAQDAARESEPLFVSRHVTEPGSFTRGVEGPAVDAQGNVYAVNFERQGTIGIVTPDGAARVFLELPENSIGNGIRFDSRGDMFIADYVGHNIYRVDMSTGDLSVFAHEPAMNQPNDLAIGSNDILFASDPNWGASTGKLWRVDPDGTVTLLEDDMGTTNGIEVGPDDATLYVNESVQRNVWAYDLSPSGEISNKRLLIHFDDEFGMDGMRADVDGNLYITRHQKGVVAIVSKEGAVIREVPTAEGRNVSNVAFGGPDGRTVYVTVADVGNIQAFRTDRPGRSWALRRRA